MTTTMTKFERQRRAAILSRLVHPALVAAALALGSGVAIGAKPAPDAPAEAGYLTGRLLVARPGMRDPRFVQTVIVIVKHDADGAMGLVVNRLLGLSPLADLLEDLGVDHEGVTGDIPVHYGGPVEQQYGFVLHSTDYLRDGTVVVSERLALSVGIDILRAISAGEGPRHSLFALGYAGWGPGQLEDELRREVWVTAPADDGIIFDDELDTKWKRALVRRGIDL